MNAMILKEIRENAKWALLILLAVAAALGGVLIASDRDGHLTCREMQTATVVTFAVAGFALGMLQILQDSAQGRWAFLMHRPISASRIFFAKVIVGVAMYLVVTVVPLAAVIWYVATPGHFAEPFERHMILPRLADLVGGLVWYGAGLLVATRQARWIGSRLMPTAVAFVASGWGHDAALSFGEATLSAALGMAILFPAAWGVFITSGEYETQPALTKPLCGLAVGTGLTMVLIVAAGLCVGAIEMLTAPTLDFSDSRYRIDKTGRVILEVTNSRRVMHWTDLQGREVPGTLATSAEISLWVNRPDASWHSRRACFSLQDPERYAQLMYGVGMIEWFYVVERRTIEGYDVFSRRCVGNIAPDAAGGIGQGTDVFPEPLYAQYGNLPWIAGATRAYRIDWESRQAHLLFAASPDDPIVEVGIRSQEKDLSVSNPLSPVYWVVVTRSTVHILHRDSSPWVTVPLEHAWPAYGELSVSQMADGRFIFYYRGEYDSSAKSRNRDWVVEADDHGNILGRTELPLLPGFTWRGSESDWSQIAGGLVAPPVLMALSAIFNSEPYGTPLVVGQVISVLVALVLILRLARRYNLSPSGKIIWGLLGLVLGIVGVLLLISLRQRQGQIVCSSCGKRRIVSQEHCQHCGAPFVLVHDDGIEIFAPV